MLSETQVLSIRMFLLCLIAFGAFKLYEFAESVYPDCEKAVHVSKKVPRASLEFVSKLSDDSEERQRVRNLKLTEGNRPKPKTPPAEETEGCP